MRPAAKTALACFALLLVFAAVSWTAIDSKGATYDEPYHALSAWLQLHFGDFRMDNEDPPLWMYWASIPNGNAALKADFATPVWTTMPQQVVHQWYWGVVTLYRTAGNDPVALIHRCRAMMLMMAVALGACIARWAWQIGGAVAAIAATAVFSLDPNFIAHGSLMKNDVVFALSMFLLAWELWKAGKRLTAWGIARIALLCIVALTVKFSGLVAVTLVPVLLGMRALLPQPWLVLGGVVKSKTSRLLVAAVLVTFSMVVSFAGIWAVYGFRFRPTPQTGVWLNMTELSDRAMQNRIIANGGEDSTAQSVAVDAALLANKHGLLPQAFLAGFLFTYANAQAHPAFAAGQISMVGWWWYFPFAMLVKTPLATILAAVVAATIAIHRRAFGWTALCLAVPLVIFLGSAIHSNFNIGIRHILPIYPFAFVAIGWAAGAIWNGGNKFGRVILCGLGIALALESLAAYPDFIPFFNAIASNCDGGKINLLGDSNLDWGQDLPLLAEWQRGHPGVPIYLSYFGYEDPAFYHIRYTPLPGGYHYDPAPKFPDRYERCVLAISATNLQGVLEPPELREFYQRCRGLKLREILGGTIYLFDYDPSAG